ncbi:hypothetical protein PENDEC_c027G06612 [Penicillium decumbens]|uniref:IPT/TIG domain-containing protein n=1 Tax=Penicillium decumbens TaxID=69771 RepID=A0A1V6NZ80_PENDC|nr:hypothetical protein PENDEC_c027G06612 [Penicillium decumbens]
MSAPTISKLTPSSGPVGTTVLISGTNLGSATAVTFGAASATILSNSGTSIFVTAPTGTGTVPVVVTTALGSSTQPVQFTYSSPPGPVISLLSPTSGPLSGGNLVTINGSNLSTTTAVSFGGTPATSFAILSNTQVAAIAPAGAAVGTIQVNVTNPTGTSGNLSYNYMAAPTVTAVTPASGAKSGGNTITITGTGFTGATAVSVNGTPASSFAIISPTTITAVVPPGVGTGPVVVTTSGGSNTTGPSYIYSAGAVASDATPAVGTTAGGDTLTITGSGLAGTTSVNFGTTPGTITSVSDTSIGVVTPASVAGTVPININTTSGTNSSLSYSFVAPPVLSSITPSTGTTAGGTAVSLTGQNLASTSGVYFISPSTVIPATSFTVNSDLSLSAVTPAAAAGSYAVQAVTAAGLSNGVSYTFT